MRGGSDHVPELPRPMTLMFLILLEATRAYKTDEVTNLLNTEVLTFYHVRRANDRRPLLLQTGLHSSKMAIKLM